MNMLVVIEDQQTNERHERRTNTLGSLLDVRCPGGGSIHPILGAWCVLCGAKVVQVRQVD